MVFTRRRASKLHSNGDRWNEKIQLIVTCGVIVNALRSHDYHGIFARHINPKIDDYLINK